MSCAKIRGHGVGGGRGCCREVFEGTRKNRGEGQLIY